jgi:4-hydroxybenzoate polyprenyltransferase
MNKMTKSIKSFLILLAYSNILLAIGASLAAFTACVILNFFGPNFSFIPLLIIFLITFSIYNFNRKTDLKEDKINHPERVNFIKKHEKILFVLSVLSYALALSFSLVRNIETFLISILPLVIMTLYSIKWTPESIKRKLKFSRLKEIPIIKNTVVSMTWAAMIFVLIFYLSLPITIATWVAFFLLFLRFFINTVMFDVRDTVGDRIFNIRTLPAAFGFIKTKYILYGINLFIILFLLAAAFLNLASPVALHLVNLSNLYSLWYISRIDKNDKKFLADVIVDGEYFVIGLLALIAYFIIY